jgi:translation initiation factor IF-3
MPASRTGGRARFVRSGGGDREIERQLRVNERVRAREVRLIDENGVQLGIMSSRDALGLARERELDLIEVAPSSQPPVCRIMDYGKHKYEQAKRDREARKRQRSTEVRLLRMKSPQISEHDMLTKVRKLRQMLGEGSKVRVSLRFRGREMTKPELGTALLARIAEELSDVAQLEAPPRREGRMMSVMLVPKPGARPPKPAKPKEEPKREKATRHAQEQVEKEPQLTQQLSQTADPEDGGETG